MNRFETQINRYEREYYAQEPSAEHAARFAQAEKKHYEHHIAQGGFVIRQWLDCLKPQAGDSVEVLKQKLDVLNGLVGATAACEREVTEEINRRTGDINPPLERSAHWLMERSAH